jgi:aryl-alcohol dehydrogenase-like predicted oxidoreductase
MELDPRSNANRERKMKYRTLGSTDIAVSEVGFGVWTVSTGWWGEVDDERSVRLLREARERGINYFDTADTYGSGKGETLLADAFGHVRDEVVISTKIGYDFYNHTARRGQQERWTPSRTKGSLPSWKSSRARVRSGPTASPSGPR